MRARRLSIVAALVILVAAVAATVAMGAGGRVGLDTNYGTEGVVKLNPPTPEGEGTERLPSPFYSALGFAAASDGSAYVLAGVSNCRKACRTGPAVLRYTPSGKADGHFGGSGRLELPTDGNSYTVGVDAAGRVLVAYAREATVVVSRFGADGAADRGFGKGGEKVLHCECGGGYRQFRWVRAPKGRMLLVVVRELPGREGGGTQFEIFRFLAGGDLDHSFGKAGKLTYVSPHGELPRAVVVANGGAILIGGSKCCGARRIFLERIGPGGKLDRAFDRIAASSARRLSALGEFPTLAALAPSPDGGVSVLGTSEGRRGFDLRLRKDGRLMKTFGHEGLALLPFGVESAAPGVDGAIFALGGYYRAHRILPNGRVDHSYGGAGGISVPLSGGPARVTPIAPGKFLVTDKGDYECIRQCSPAEPGLVRFLE
jgi:uncharacterized delta-60 repeat protein